MKKIINGRKYDTETAIKMFCFDHEPEDRLYRYSETLYRKQNGEFFLHGEGGPASIYGLKVRYCTWRSGRKIKPLSRYKALEWIRENCSEEDYLNLASMGV